MILEKICYMLSLADDFQIAFICCAIAGIISGNLDEAKDVAMIFPSVTKLSNRRIIGINDLQEQHLQMQVIQFRLCNMFYSSNWNDFPFSSSSVVFLQSFWY